MVRESASHHLFLKHHFFLSKFDFFSLEMFPGWCGIIFPKITIFTIFIIFSTFLWHISSSDQGFPWSNQADTWPGQSSNIILKLLLRICQTNKYFYQKYWVKVSKSCTSAGTPKISRRPAQRQRWGRVLRTIYFKNINFFIEIRFFWSWNVPRMMWDHFPKNHNFHNFRHFFDFFVTHFLFGPSLPVVQSGSYLARSKF